MKHAGGETIVARYMINVYLPHKVAFAGVLAAEAQTTGGMFDVIIGMDIICFGDFTISNVDAKTWVSFRTPSIQAVDYVTETKIQLYEGTPRNALCPCNSGKKYKRCHGA